MSGCDHASAGLTINCKVKCLVVTMLCAGLTINCTVKCLVVTMLRVGLTINCTVKCLVVTMLHAGLRVSYTHSKKAMKDEKVGNCLPNVIRKSRFVFSS